MRSFGFLGKKGLVFEFGERKEGRSFLEEVVDCRMGEVCVVCSELCPTDSFFDEPRTRASEVEKVELDLGQGKYQNMQNEKGCT